MNGMAENKLIGNGWRFPIRPDESGSLGYVSGDENIEQSLKILLMTGLGERVMRSDFGTAAPRLVFAPGSEQYLRLLETTVREAVRDWEPRIKLESVRAETIPENETQVMVNIAYQVRRTNTRHNLVYPFYVGTTEAV
jgi:phage baseplate assembly protein W